MAKQDLVILGGGAGGLVVASVMAQLGLKVTLIEKARQLGGDCLHSGCVPSKTLIHSARIAHLMRHADRFGLPACDKEIEFEKVIDHVNDVIGHIQKHDDPERFRQYGCDVHFGKAKFLSPHEVAVGDEIIRGRKFIIATGSYPVIPPIPGLAESGYLTNETIFSRRQLPKTLAVIGGGPIGVELAQAFARFGSQVTIFESSPALLAREDPEVSQTLADVLRREGVALELSAQISTIRREGEMRQISMADGRAFDCEQILVATGRRPSLSGLQLDKAGVETKSGHLILDNRLRTSQKHIYAVGDAAGPYQFTHMAEYQAGVAIANIAFKFPKKVDYRLVPQVTYTDPEVASIGLSESELIQQGVKYITARFPFSDIDRAITEGETDGLAKIFLQGNKIAGATLIGPHAGELIHELSLAMRLNAKARDVADMIHAYPGYSQIHRRTINQHYSKLLLSGKIRFLVKLLNRLLP